MSDDPKRLAPHAGRRNPARRRSPRQYITMSRPSSSEPEGVEGDCPRHDQQTGPMGDVVGVTRHVIDSLMAFHCLFGNKHSRFRAGDVCSLAEERDRRQGERAPFAADPESPCRTDVRNDRGHAPRALSERVFTCLYGAGRGGIMREPEGIETPLPGKSSERTWS